jgi:hypothetical protein
MGVWFRAWGLSTASLLIILFSTGLLSCTSLLSSLSLIIYHGRMSFLVPTLIFIWLNPSLLRISCFIVEAVE